MHEAFVNHFEVMQIQVPFAGRLNLLAKFLLVEFYFDQLSDIVNQPTSISLIRVLVS